MATVPITARFLFSSFRPLPIFSLRPLSCLLNANNPLIQQLQLPCLLNANNLLIQVLQLTRPPKKHEFLLPQLLPHLHQMRKSAIPWIIVSILGFHFTFWFIRRLRNCLKVSRYIPHCLFIYGSRPQMIFSSPVMYSGQPFLSIKEDVRRGRWGICWRSLSPRMLCLSRQQRRKELVTKTPSFASIIQLRSILSQPQMPSQTNGFLLLRVNFGFLSLQKRGKPSSQI
jgi:hypothetical protein